MTSTVLIASEEDAWRLLTEITEGRLLGPEVQIEFQDWPTITLRFTGPSWNETIPARMLQPVLELQREIYRSYALMKYGDQGVRLSKEEKSQLEIFLRIRPGSSIVDAAASGSFNELLKGVLMPIDQTHSTGIILGIALLYGSVMMWKIWVQSREKIALSEMDFKKEIALFEKEATLSEQETERMKVFAQAMKMDDRLVLIQEGVDENRRRLLTVMRPGDAVNMGGIKMGQEEVSHLTRNPRKTSLPVRTDGIYRILQVDASKNDCFTLKVKGVEDGQTITALLPNTYISTDMQDALQNAEWGRELVRLEINAKSVDGQISNAEIVSCVPAGSSAT